MTILVRKASGEEEPFDQRKLESSLLQAGAAGDAVREIIEDISDWIYQGVTTRKIYSRAFQLLKRLKGVAALRYRLKQAMMELGPTGYPFECFIGQIFSKQGFEVKTGQVLGGMCITHEMDVVATGVSVQHLVECKYAQDQGKYVTVQIPLYVRSRINDIVDRYRTDGRYEGFTFTGWVATNTRFSSDSIAYASCSGLKLLGWDYPDGKSLKQIVEAERMYPVSVLTQLSNREKQQIIEKGVVTCIQLLNTLDVLDEIQFRRNKSTALLKELNDITTLPII
ncbi:MAG: ATP-binding protein [Bacteroidetes bacterium]|nr:ATP-binding protein [Bacteroidota bacterium]